MDSASRPASLALADLSSAIESAVGRVAEEHGLRFGSDVVLGPGTIVGRWIDGKVDIRTIEKASEEISGHVADHDAIRTQAGGISPAFMWQRGHIIMGIVYEPAAFQR
ncbi:MAG: hypothetical protein QOK28_3374 [Actinomycetota bacterium]|jgi:hypothetical protein